VWAFNAAAAKLGERPGGCKGFLALRPKKRSPAQRCAGRGFGVVCAGRGQPQQLPLQQQSLPQLPPQQQSSQQQSVDPFDIVSSG
jgi:hypothetical protein